MESKGGLNMENENKPIEFEIKKTKSGKSFIEMGTKGNKSHYLLVPKAKFDSGELKPDGNYMVKLTLIEAIELESEVKE